MNLLSGLTVSLITILFLCAADQSHAEECLQCHADIARQIQGNSHHIQGTPATSKHCYACHWEATIAGEVDPLFHQQDSNRIDLVIWGAGKRPTEHLEGNTAITFSTAAIDTKGERDGIAKITRHCLGCHSDSNNNTATFPGDTNTPRKYAWDGQSIASRYLEKRVVRWGKYSTTSTNKKHQVTKALSAHGNAAANEGGWSQSGGYDSRIPVTRGSEGARNVECYDCHNSHGSTITGTTSTYRKTDGSQSGGILKQTTAGRSGYRMDYTPSANRDHGSKNPYNPGAGLCFDCHETEVSGITPWGYSSTFAANQPIMGYKDTHRFGPGIKGSTSRYSSRQSRSGIVSSHLKADIFLKYSATASINGLCAPCHDPHGVSQTLGEKMEYAIPLLKGTWLTSPYREDSPPKVSPGKAVNKMEQEPTGTTRGPVSMQGMQYSVDRNTFGGEGRIIENIETFAGLCLNCHNRLGTNFDSKTARIHKAVKGWGENREHSFPCSKCHQAHNSGLPRLMQTNCFEEGPAGLRDNMGASWISGKQRAGGTRESASQTSAGNSKSSKTGFVGCHVRQFGRSGSKPSEKNEGEWNEKTRW